MNLPKIEDLDVSGKKVLVRADLDVGEKESDINRLKILIPTFEYLSQKKSEVILIGHKGRPGGKVVEELSLKTTSQLLENLLKEEWGEKRVKKLKMHLMENLRFYQGEEANSQEYTQELAKKGEVYINEAFAASHREHASIVGLPRLLPHAAGLHFQKEVENLTRVLEKAEKPIIVLMGGLKKDKLLYIDDFKKFADKILIAGRLPEYMPEVVDDPQLVVARLLADKEDITIHSIENFNQEIARAKTIVLAGPMGKFEEEGHRAGTERIFQAAANSTAFKVAGGGDTERALTLLGLKQKFDWVSVGGGAMLEFLAKGSLPGIEALVSHRGHTH